MSAAAEGNDPTKSRGFFGHPVGLSTLFATEMWERFSYYGIRPLLILFMTTAVMSGGFGFERPMASAIVGIYAASVYLASLPGGWIADRWFGLRRSIQIGAVLITLGHLSIGLTSFFEQRTPFFVGLILIVLGTGLLKPNISAIVGDLYPEGGARRDAGFSVFYMGINVGATAGQLVTGSRRSKTSSSPSISSICWPTCRNPSELMRAREGTLCGATEATQVQARPVAHAQSSNARTPSRA